MFKNLVKKIKGVAKKVAPYAGVVAGMFGASPLMAAGIGALGGGLGTGNMKGAVLGGLGGFGSGTMYGGANKLFDAKALIGKGGPGGFFNPNQKGIADLLLGQVRTPGPQVFDTGTMSMVDTADTVGPSGLDRFKEALTMENNPLTGNKLKENSMYRFLPTAAAGTALAYGLGAFDEEPVPEDEIPTEYVYNAATDPLKNVNKRFQDYYQGITQVAPSSIYGYLQSIGALKEGGIPRGYSGGGSMAQKMDVPGQFLLNDPSKSPLSVLEAADGMGIQDLEQYVDTGEGEGMDKGVGAAKEVLMMGAEEAMKELGTNNSSDDGKRMLDLTKGQEEAVKDGATQVEMTDAQEKFYSSPSDEGKTFGNGEFYYDDPKLIEFIQRRADSNGTTYQEELFKFVDEVEGFYRNKKADGGDLEILDQIEIVQGLMDKESDPLRQSFFADKIVELRKRVLDSYNSNANGGVAAFNHGGQIMGPGTGREDIIPGKIVDKNTGQTSDMLVSNNEHIIPEYALYAMGGGDTKKGHDMMDALRKQTKPMAQDMGYNFKGAEDGSVMYG
tara:strand:+ start:4177 stop:5844 length:1668 start_codon:yes stop_codon:yes gene_type:complete